MPNAIGAIGWAVRERLAGYEVLIWADGVVLFRDHAMTREAAERLAVSMRMKLLPEAFRQEEKEVEA